MAIVTVSGEIAAADLGVTICHEHCFIDLRALFDGDVRFSSAFGTEW